MRSGMGSTGLDWARWAALSCSVATLSEPPEVSEARFSSTWPPDDGRHHTFPAALHGGCDAEHPPRASTNPHCRRSLHSSTLNKRPPVSTIARSSTRHRWLVRGLSHVASGAQVRQAGRKQRAVHHLAHVRTHARNATHARTRARAHDSGSARHRRLPRTPSPRHGGSPRRGDGMSRSSTLKRPAHVSRAGASVAPRSAPARRFGSSAPPRLPGGAARPRSATARHPPGGAPCSQGQRPAAQAAKCASAACADSGVWGLSLTGRVGRVTNAGARSARCQRRCSCDEQGARGARAASVAAPATSRGRAGEEATVYYYDACSLQVLRCEKLPIAIL